MTLETIKVELWHFFRQARKAFEGASPNAIITLPTGETNQTLNSRKYATGLYSADLIPGEHFSLKTADIVC